MRRTLATIGIAAALVGSACGGTLVRLEAKGNHDEVIARANARRWPPRRAAARALARSFVATGNAERARDILLGDFRRGGQIPSLVALADLERTLGRDGVAAVHYARVFELDRTVLRGRRDVCALFVTRAAAWVALTEGTAALDDLDAAGALCGIEDAPLRRAAHAHLEQRLRTRRLPPTCTGDCVPRPAPDVLAAAIDAARAKGPAALRELAAQRRLSLAAADVIALLLADARGQAGPPLLDDDELRMWIGDGVADDFVAPVRASTMPEASYLRLRLEQVLGRSPDGGVASPSQRAIWLDRASVIEGAVRWRILAVTGDMTAAEQDLVGRWRPREATAAPTGADTVVPSGPHWSLRTEVTADNLRELLVLARLRDGDDDPDLGLELRRAALHAAEHAALPEAGAALADEVFDALAWGRPWIALAIADVAGTADVEPLRRAAATGVLLGEAACEGPCPESAADLDTVSRVLGEPWIERTRSSLRALAGARVQSRAPAGACPSLEEVLAPPSSTPLGRALAQMREQMRDGEATGLARALVIAIESDPSLACGARFALPLLVDQEAGVTTARLSDYLAHGPAQTVAPALTMHAALAVLGSQYTRAEHLGVAAAAKGVPKDTWRELARHARRVGARDLEMLALREVLLHSAGFEDDVVRREMVAHTVLDGARAWGVRDTPAGRESVAFVVDEHLARLHPAERWAEREAITEAVLERRSDAAVLEVVARTLMPTEHLATAGLGEGAGASPRGGGGGSWSPRQLAQLARAHRLVDVPRAIAVFADARRMTALRRALAEDARDWGVRRRAAIGLAIAGGAADRAVGAAALMSMATPKSRPALERLLLGRPAALDDRGAAPTTVVADDVVLLHVLFGLPPEAALWLGRPAEVP